MSFVPDPSVTPSLQRLDIHLVDVESLHLILRLSEPFIATLHDDLDNPSNNCGTGREGSAREHGRLILRRILGIPEVGGPDERGVHHSGDNRDGCCLLLCALATSGTNPTQDQRVDCVCADREDNHGKILDASVHHESTDDEANDGN
jgi:hypothetical protein